ncbi:hypothetical protein VTJ49DRAFT_5364 [Mycothermus thermophilus]|uniref:PrpF protein n=1 Tax=Humicola insolens TaxID=85995 RepID=A0ABR3VKU9_HUMIN
MGFRGCSRVNSRFIHNTPKAAAKPLAPVSRGTQSIRALFARGGTSNGLVIWKHDLPPEDEWPKVLPALMGSPDPFGRQLDGMGSGISSTSKICILSPPSDPAVADVDFTFVQVGIKDGSLDLAGNCGNLISVVGPVAWDAVLSHARPPPPGPDPDKATVRIFNTNTNKLIHSTFSITLPSSDPSSRRVYNPAGTYHIAGVPTLSSPIHLRFLHPGGAKTGRTLPTGNPIDTLSLSDNTTIDASLVDVSNPGVFIRASDLGFPPTVSPQDLRATIESDPALLERLESIRRAGAERMGMDPDTQSVPKIVLVLPGDADAGVHLRCQALSMGQPHKAVPLTLAMCLGAAAGLEGTIPNTLAVGLNRGEGQQGESVVAIGHPAGSIELAGARLWPERGGLAPSELQGVSCSRIEASAEAEGCADDFGEITGADAVRHFNYITSAVFPISATAPGVPPSDLLSRLPRSDRALFNRRLADVPRCMYPHEDLLAYNPARGPDFTAMAVSDDAAVHCVLMCSSVVDAAEEDSWTTEDLDYNNSHGYGREGEDDYNDDDNNDRLAHYVSNTCAMLSQKLDRDRDRDHLADVVTLHCIATLAWVGYYTNRLDHWQLHMSGLKKVLDLNGGALEGLPPWLVDELHRADLQGAVALACTPYLPLQPNMQWRNDSNSISISDVLPADVRDRTARVVAEVLQPLGIHGDVVSTLACLTVFAGAVRLARRSCGAVVFDPQAFSWELHALTHALLNPVTSVLELIQALRIAALLYLKHLLPDFPRTPSGSFTVLLTLLRRHLRELLDLEDRLAGKEQTAGASTDAESVQGHTAQTLRQNLRCAALFLTLVGASASRAAELDDRDVAGSTNLAITPTTLYMERFSAGS